MRRSSSGKSNSVASISVVSSIDTLSTQLKVSLRGRPSRIWQVRSRISAFHRAPGWAARRSALTALRCSSCFGGSIAMNIWSFSPSGAIGQRDAAERPVRREHRVVGVHRHDVLVASSPTSTARTPGSPSGAPGRRGAAARSSGPPCLRRSSRGWPGRSPPAASTRRLRAPVAARRMTRRSSTVSSKVTLVLAFGQRHDDAVERVGHRHLAAQARVRAADRRRS